MVNPTQQKQVPLRARDPWGGWRCPNLRQGPVMASSPFQRPSLHATWGDPGKGGDGHKLFSQLPAVKEAPARLPGGRCGE